MKPRHLINNDHSPAPRKIFSAFLPSCLAQFLKCVYNDYSLSAKGKFSTSTMFIAEEAKYTSTSFMDRFFSGKTPDMEAIEKLCSLCDPQANTSYRSALQALYGVIIEALSNDFSTKGLELSTKVLATMINHIRKTPDGKEMDDLLHRLGLGEKKTLLQRYQQLLARPPLLENERREIKKIIIPSRITVGADVVLGSVFVQRLYQAFPNAEIVLMGPAHIPAIFHGLPNFSHCLVEYKRHGNLTDRITGWTSFHQMAKKEFSNLAPEQTLVVDPDSRITQLGLLPLAPPGRTLFFPSRYPDSVGQFSSLVQTANHWCDRQFGKNQFAWPQISLNSSLCKSVATYKRCLKAPFFPVLSFGAGNSENKRLSDQFEEQLILALLEIPNTVILLDSGTRDSGLKKVKCLLEVCKENGYQSKFLYENEIQNRPAEFTHGIIGFRGSIGALASFIQEADGFFGYDSCCQHLAAALDCPAVIAFVGASNDRFYARWRSQGKKNLTKTIRVDLSNNENPPELNNLIIRIVNEFKTIAKYHKQ